MRLSDLLGCTVHDPDGTCLGTVTDVRLAQIGPIEGPSAELVIESLLVSPRATGSLFGYERRAEQGPWLVRAVVRWIHRGAFLIAWNDVADWNPTDHRMSVSSNHHRLPPTGHQP
jgi:sporulation protein YlmC with PRC-barrel domain